MDGAGFGGLTRVAVLVDGDNIRALHQPAVMAEARRLGKVDVRRVYGHASRCEGWDGFRIIHASGAKNAADMYLAVDAMRFALVEEVEAFVIASSDRDFAPVAFALRELGRDVVGVGEPHAPATFRQACTRFLEVEAAEMPALSEALRRAFNAIRAAGGEMPMGQVGHALGKRPEGCAKWQAVLKERPEVFGFVGEGKDLRVRLTSAAEKVR